MFSAERTVVFVTDPAYTVGDYLLDRLAELGVSEIFGVPGDYNLAFLDHIVAHPTIRWVGSANELNAGYAADGYGRLRGMSAVVTTFGVGELSAANAIAGSYAEHVPVVHIVGGPSKDAQGARRALHHSLGDGDFEHFFRISREITCAQANLMPATACREIDRVLSEVREQKRPGYILLSTDVARFPTEPPADPLPRYTGGTSPRALSLFVEAATELIGDHQLTVLADLLVHRLQAVKELEALLAADVVPHATLMWGKSLLDESSPNFLGIYAGAASAEWVRAAIEQAPVLVTAGVVFTDMVSGFFSQRIDPARTIDVGSTKAAWPAKSSRRWKWAPRWRHWRQSWSGAGSPHRPSSRRPPNRYRHPQRAISPSPNGCCGTACAPRSHRETWCSPTKAPRSTAWRITGCRTGSPSSANHFGAQSVTRCPRPSEPRCRIPTAGRCC